MKVKQPKIYSYQQMVDEYSSIPERINLSENPIVGMVFRETKTMRGKRDQILHLLKKYKYQLREVEEAMVDYARERVIVYPQVSPLLIKQKRKFSDESEYYSGRVMWPEMDGKQRELRVYLGKKEEYPDFKDFSVIRKAQKKISDKLRDRVAMNTLEKNQE
jgi:hypothetical protein